MRALSLLACLICGLANAGDRCFDVSTAREGANSVAELCVVETANDVSLTLTGGGATVVYQLQLLNRVRCSDCNKDVFGPASPNGLDLMSIRFDGKRENGVERGVVSIGSQRLQYRSKTGAPPPQPPPPSGPEPMSPESFAGVLAALEGQSWSVSGIDGVVSSASKRNHFTSAQVVAILKKVPGLSLRLSAVKRLVPRIVDPENLFLVSGELGQDAEKFRSSGPH